jgi:hypothetical protein
MQNPVPGKVCVMRPPDRQHVYFGIWAGSVSVSLLQSCLSAEGKQELSESRGLISSLIAGCMGRASRCKARCYARGIVSRRWMSAQTAFCGDSLQQREKAVLKYAINAIIGARPSPARQPIRFSWPEIPGWPGKPRPPPISFDAGGGGRVTRVKESRSSSQSGSRIIRNMPTSNAGARPRVTRGTVAFGSGSATFSRDQGARGHKPWRFSLALCRAPVQADDPSEPALRPRVSTTRRPTTSNPSAQ